MCRDEREEFIFTAGAGSNLQSEPRSVGQMQRNGYCRITDETERHSEEIIVVHVNVVFGGQTAFNRRNGRVHRRRPEQDINVVLVENLVHRIDQQRPHLLGRMVE